LTGNVRVEDARVHLEDARMRFGAALLAMSGTIDQNNGRLNLKLWYVGRAEDEKRSHGADPAPAARPETPTDSDADGASRPAVAKSDAAVRSDTTSGASGRERATHDAPAAVTAGVAPGGSASDSTASPTGSDGPVTFKEKLKAQHEIVKSKALGLKEKLDNKALETKEQLDARAETLSDDLRTHREGVKADIQEKLSEVKEKTQERTEEKKAKIQAKLEMLKDRLDDRRDAMREALEARFGRPMLCITGTTAQPEVDLCRGEIEE